MEMEDQPQGRASDLKALAEAKFGKLSEAEKLLLQKVPSGEPAVCSPSHDYSDNDPNNADGWAPTRQIRAELVGWLCMDQKARKHVHWRGIQVYGADINGPLDLSFVDIPFPLVLQHCRRKEGTDLSRAEVSELDLSGSLVCGITADSLIVKNNVFLSDGFAAVGEVRLTGAKIGGNLECDAGTFTNPPRKDVAGSGTALQADGINVRGDVFLRGGFAASGEVRLTGAQIGGDLSCTGGTFTNPPQKDLPRSGSALNADRINVKGSAFFRGTTANGEVRLTGAQIGSNLECYGGVFTNPPQDGVDGSGKALKADRINVGGSVLLNGKFTASGEMRFIGAQISVAFDCENGNFQAATLDLSDALANTIYDPEVKWPVHDKLVLDGFAYGRISTEEQVDVTKRLDWLGLQSTSLFRQQPYLQLAKVLRESGDSGGALRVLEKMEELRRSSEKHGPGARIWSWILKGSIGYGYYPGRAIRLIILLSVVGWIVYGASYDAGTIVPTDKDAYKEFVDPKTERQVPPHYPGFSAPVYSLENSLPLVKLRQADKWQPDPHRKGFLPTSVPWFLRIQILLGWLLATLFVAGVSGIVHKE